MVSELMLLPMLAVPTLLGAMTKQFVPTHARLPYWLLVLTLTEESTLKTTNNVVTVLTPQSGNYITKQVSSQVLESW